MEKIVASTFMTKGACSVPSDTSLKVIVEKVRRRKISCLVITEDESPVGIVTEQDLVRVLYQSLDEGTGWSQLNARDIMSTPPITCKTETSFYDALVILQTQKIKHLPVTNSDETLAGIITYSDLSHKYVNYLDQQREEIISSKKQLLNDNSKLKSLSFEDPLMEIGNRRAMEVDIEYTHNLSLRYKNHYSIIFIDVDWFKSFNDHYGHQKGDNALKEVAKTLKSTVRKSDRIYRYGGEEILLILPQTKEKGCLILAGRLVDKVSEKAIPHTKSPLNILTISCGIANFSPVKDDTRTWRDLVHMADSGLYKAKKEGRCRVG